MWWWTSYCSPLLIYRPREDERLSWPGWLTYSGRLTHISYGSNTGRQKNAGQRLAFTTEPRGPTAMPSIACYFCSSCYRYAADTGTRVRLLVSLLRYQKMIRCWSYVTYWHHSWSIITCPGLSDNRWPELNLICDWPSNATDIIVLCHLCIYTLCSEKRCHFIFDYNACTY